MNAGMQLQVVYDWRETCLAQRLLAPGQRVTFGTGPRTTLVAPEGQADHHGRDPWPREMVFLRPTRKGYRLRLVPAMTGLLNLQGQSVDIGSLFTTPAPKKLFGKPGLHRDVELSLGDTAVVVVDAVNQLRISLSFVEAPEKLRRPRGLEPFFFKTAFWTVNSMLAALIVILFVGSRVPPFRPELAITPTRLAKLVPTAPAQTAKRAADEKAQLAAEEARRKKADREAAEAKKAKLAEGRLGHPDAPRRETVLPKGREDVLREKVQKTGILSALGRARSSGSSLSNLLSSETADIEQAVTGLQGAKLAMGKGSGLGVAGSGLGGGGTTFGKIGGTGNLDLGTGRTRGRRGPGLGGVREKQVSGLETGKADAEGGLTREQVERVVQAHKTAIKYCYEKELQRAPGMNGKVDVSWVIRPNGSVDRNRIAKSTLDNAAVEGCIARTVRSWQFPKSDADTIVNYPFFFKGGG